MRGWYEVTFVEDSYPRRVVVQLVDPPEVGGLVRDFIQADDGRIVRDRLRMVAAWRHIDRPSGMRLA